MPTGGRHFQRTPRALLAADLGEIHAGQDGILRRRGQGLPGFELFPPQQKGHALGKMRGRVDRHVPDHSRLGAVVRRQDDGSEAQLPGHDGQGQHAGHRPERTGKGKLSGKDPALQGFHGDLPAGRQQAKGQGQVEGRAALAASGRGQVHGDARGRQAKTAGPQGRKDPLPGLAHGRLGQAHQREAGQALTHQVHFHIHREGIHPFQTGTVQSYDHTPPPRRRRPSAERTSLYGMTVAPARTAAVKKALPHLRQRL